MSSLLEEIKKLFYKNAPYPGVYQGNIEQHTWEAKLAMDDLIDEVERLEKVNGYHQRRMKMYEKRAVHLAAENDQLRHIFKMTDRGIDELQKLVKEKKYESSK
jgi:gamma-glutamylcyclotransferase (GGCT)/AIG2-like uncharacterized protein YtfP